MLNQQIVFVFKNAKCAWRGLTVCNVSLLVLEAVVLEACWNVYRTDQVSVNYLTPPELTFVNKEGSNQRAIYCKFVLVKIGQILFPDLPEKKEKNERSRTILKV